jgi:hypothetical protein
MFRITQDPSSGSDNLYLIEITYNGSNVLIMCVVSVWSHILDLWCVCVCVCVCVLHIWTIICNFNQVQVITPWWWILCDPKHVGVIFNACLLDFNVIQFLTSMTFIYEYISGLIQVNYLPLLPNIHISLCHLQLRGNPLMLSDLCLCTPRVPKHVAK